MFTFLLFIYFYYNLFNVFFLIQVFKKEEIEKFLLLPDTLKLLSLKVIMILGVHGGLRRAELMALMFSNVMFNEKTEHIMMQGLLRKVQPKKASLHTGHCFRRTGATLLAEGGCSVYQLKDAGRYC